MRPTLERLVQELGIASHVHFLGVRRDIPDLMNGADAFVLASAWEGLPMVLLEAAASGLPLVATDVGGVREIVRDGINGFLCPPGQSDALADVMKRVMALPPEKRAAMGEASRELVRRTFDIDQVVTRWEQLYQRLLEDSISTEHEVS